MSLRIAMILSSMAQLGWAIVAFGSLLFWQIVAHGDYSFVTERGPTAHASGVVTAAEKTGYSESKRPVMANHYRFTVNGRVYNGTSYTTGTRVVGGSSVDVEYSADDPARSRIAGQRRDKFSAVVAFLVIIPLAGALVAARGMRRGAMRAALLRDGMLTGAKLEQKQATNVTQNRRRVYLLSFAFTARDGRKYAVSARTTDTARLEDETTEAVLYDPENPDRAFLLDELPSRPKFDDMGELRPRRMAAIGVLILPVVVIFGNLLRLM